MKDTIEKIKIMQAFVDGKDIEHYGDDEMFGIITFNREDVKKPLWNWEMFAYRIKQNWDENIPDSGVICWVSDADEPPCKNLIALIHSRELSVFRQLGRNKVWRYAAPLTRNELETYMRACPE